MNFLYPLFRADRLSAFVVLIIGLLFVLTLIYSLRFMRGRPSLIQYYACIVLTALASIGVVLANNLILLLILWGFLGLTLYLLISMGGKDSARVAKKTFIIVGGSDALMILGIGIIYYLTGSFEMDRIKISLISRSTFLPLAAYLSIAIACFAKAGVMPFHSWVPDCAESAPASVVAYLPASLDKLLGIYLLARISLDLFILNQSVNMLLMLIGAFTIIAAVMMAMVQHNMKRLLGYCAVSQVGYMVLGIGTGIPIGIAGGLFHMLNHAVYKACLFFTAGNVEYRTKTAELDELGGLAKVMPITYITCFIASLAISGVPPFNGFVSKWMIYQGLIDRLTLGREKFTVGLCLIAAMFGSSLTLASFMKLLHASFLGQQAKKTADQSPKEVPWMMWLPCAILAIICVVFGIFAYQIPLKYFIFPAVSDVTFRGSWFPGISSLLVIAGLLLGILIFMLTRLKPVLRQDTPFVGAGTMDLVEDRVSGTEFYNTVKEFRILKGIYHKAEEGFFDIYEQGKNLVFGMGKFLKYLHNGVLPTYLVWTLLGMIGLFFVMMR